jgi:hypothetical protein
MKLKLDFHRKSFFILAVAFIFYGCTNLPKIKMHYSDKDVVGQQ